ncbi:MAG: hypothetical protein WD036_12025 [Bauldia sp.]
MSKVSGGDTPGVSDPATFGEDLAGNFRDVVGIAARHCRDCADYHIAFCGRRVANPAAGISVDRGRIISIVAGLLAAKASHGDAIDVLIVGSADTGLLATAARAAFLAGPEVAGRVRYTVLDRCGTPLELCAAYGPRNGLDVSTHLVEVPDTDLSAAADVIVVHSLFRAVAKARHGALLALLARWLKADGRLVFSQSLRSAGEPPRRPQMVATLMDMIESGGLSLPEPYDVFIARLGRHVAAESVALSEYGTKGEMLALFAASPFTAIDVEEMGREATVGGSVVRRRRLIAVLKKLG